MITVCVALGTLRGWMAPQTLGAETPPQVASISVPQGGSMQILFRSKTEGPFRLQTKKSIDAPWFDVPDAIVTAIESGVYMALVSKGLQDDMGFFRVVSEHDTVAELKGWNLLLQVSAPANGQYFVPGEGPVVTVTILDTMLQGVSRADLSTLNLYLHGPQDPQLTVTASKLLNAVTDRSKRPHHYIDLKTNPDVKVNGNRLTYPLRPVTDEALGTYTLSLYSVLGSDTIQQVMKLADLQIGTATVEKPVVTKAQCAACHEGPISGKMYLHHVNPGRSPTGSWSLDYQPVASCKACHNNDGYAAFRDAAGAYVSDPIVLRAHGVHMGEGLKSDAYTNSVTVAFRSYTHVLFPADVRDCTTCHVDDRWKTDPSRMACASCHDNSWFGPKESTPKGMVAHEGGTQLHDAKCWKCHGPGGPGDESIAKNITDAHTIPPPKMNAIDVALTPPANGKFYVAGEKPVVSLVIKDDAGKPIDHTKVTDANFSTASLFVYGPRSRAVPVLTSAAKNVNSKLRASVTSSKAGPWAINGKIFKIAVNGSAPQDIKIVGASNLVTAAEVVASLNSVITNLNGGALATVSGANVNLRTLIQGANARFEIYNGDVTTAMGWKRAPNTVLKPDVTIAAASTQGNDLRSLAEPLDYSDPMVTRTAANIAYQLSDVSGLAPGM